MYVNQLREYVIDAMKLEHVDWTKWYKSWYQDKFGFNPEEGEHMTTETQAPSFEEQKAKLAEVEKALKEAGTKGDTDSILKLAGELKTLRASVLKSQKDVNKDAIAEVEEILRTGIEVLVKNTKYEELTGDPVKNVLWFVEVNDAGEPTGKFGVRINAGRKAPGSGGGGGGNGRKVIANQTVTRTVNGTEESLTVKEVVQKYASDEVKNSSLFEPKKAWGILFPKVNGALEVKFSEPV